MSIQRSLATLAVALLVVFTGLVPVLPIRDAVADATVSLQVRPIEKTDSKRQGLPSDIEATIIGGPSGVPIDKFTMSEPGAKVPVTLKAIQLKKYAEGNETIAIVVLVEGHESWMGNESYIEVDDDKVVGVFSKLAGVLDPLSKVGPSGSQGALIIYHQGVDVKLPMGPIANLTSDKLGNQKDFRGKATRDLVAGVNEALAQLRKVTASRKALVVIGDGADTNPDEAKAQFAGLRKTFESDHIELYGIQYVVEGLDNEGGVLKTLIPDVKVVQSVDGISAAINAVVEKINDRYYVVFPGYDPATKLGFTWDGKEHEFTVKVGDEELEPVALVTVPVWEIAKKGGMRWWAWLLIGLGALLVVVIGYNVFKKKPEPEPEPVPMPVAAPAPMPGGPMKTVMIGLGGDQDGFPIVGWIVATNGPQAFQTFRLLGGATKIGTGAPAHIIVNDGFMSTEHCQIVSSPQGFVLHDGGSTNGTLVNGRRISTHELVDNDSFTLGKTNFKFKSIN